MLSVEGVTTGVGEGRNTKMVGADENSAGGQIV